MASGSPQPISRAPQHEGSCRKLHVADALRYLDLVDRPCHRCGAVIAEGAPFCPQCGAPQIRVAVGSSAGTPLPPGTPDEIQPPAQPVFRQGIAWRAARSSIVIAGILAAIAAMVAPVGGIGILFWTFLATIVVVRLYSQRPEARLTGASGARLGAATGLSAFLAWVVLFLVAIFGRHQGPQLHEFVIQSMREASANYPTPQATQAMDFIATSGGFATFIVMMLVLLLLFSVICGAVAGALTAALFSRPAR